jgi:hypothetical protein
MRSLRAIALILCTTTLAHAADAEFRRVVHSIESNYRVHHTRIPFLGLAMFFARPAGVHGFHLAVFESMPNISSPEEVRTLVENSLDPGWYPFVRVRSRGKSDSETTLIYTRPDGNRMKMMIVNIEPSESVIVKMDISEHAMDEWMKQPGEKASGHSHHHYSED